VLIVGDATRVIRTMRITSRRTMYSLETKLKCLQREIKFRERVYPRQVELGKMDVLQAAGELAVMKEIAEDIKQQIEKERLL
jgi:hypothetical protein